MNRIIILFFLLISTSIYSVDLSNLEEVIEKGNITGAIIALVDVNGESDVFEVGDISSEDRFHIASITKSFTALAILKLAEEGYIQLDESFQIYLPWFQFSNGEEYNIRVIDLLNHSSGFPDINSWNKPEYSLRDVVESYQDLAIVTDPGSEFNYFL